MTPFLQAHQIKKSFPPNVTALRRVDLEIQPGQVHCLLGANGAGKSTLLKIIAGAHQLDEGELLVNGQRRNFASPLEAARNGISMIYQELDLIPQLTVAENLFLGRVPHRFGWIRRHYRESRTEELLSLLGASFSATDRVEQLPVSGQHHEGKNRVCFDPGAHSREEITHATITGEGGWRDRVPAISSSPSPG